MNIQSIENKIVDYILAKTSPLILHLAVSLLGALVLSGSFYIGLIFMGVK